MRSFVGNRVRIMHDGRDDCGIVSSVGGEIIKIALDSGETLEAPLFDAEVYNAPEEEKKQGIEFLIEW